MTFETLENQALGSAESPPTMGNSLNLCGRTDRLVGGQTTLRVDKVGSKDGVDQSRLSETSLAYSMALALKHIWPI